MYIYLYIAFFIYYFSVWLQMRGTFRRFSSKNLSKIARLLFYFFLYVLHMCVWLCGSVCVWCVWCVVCWCEWVEMSVHSWTKISSVCVCEAGSWHFYLQFPDFIFSTRRFSYLLSFCLRFRFRWTFLHFSFSASVFTSSLFGFFSYFILTPRRSKAIFTFSHTRTKIITQYARRLSTGFSFPQTPTRAASPRHLGHAAFFDFSWLYFGCLLLLATSFLSAEGSGCVSYIFYNAKQQNEQTSNQTQSELFQNRKNREPTATKASKRLSPKSPKKSEREREQLRTLGALSEKEESRVQVRESERTACTSFAEASKVPGTRSESQGKASRYDGDTLGKRIYLYTK